MVGLFICFFLIWSCEEKEKWAVVAGVWWEGQVVCAFSVGACENWKLEERFHLKGELYHGMPVVSALVQLEVLADVSDADLVLYKIQAVASLVRNGFGQGCVEVSNTPNNPKTRHISVTLAEIALWCAGL